MLAVKLPLRPLQLRALTVEIVLEVWEWNFERGIRFERGLKFERG
jgi:hypothetical protein